MASQVQICNLALLKFGNLEISTIADATTEARACSALWDMLRDELLYSYPWNFAMKRDEALVATTDPDFGYAHAYTLPTDCLRVWELHGSASTWAVEQGVLLTDDETADIIYIAKITDATKFTPGFVNCLATRLAADLAMKLGGNRTLRQELLKELYQVDMPRAYQLDALEGNRTLHTDEQGMDKGNYSWQREGR